MNTYKNQFMVTHTPKFLLAVVAFIFIWINPFTAHAQVPSIGKIDPVKGNVDATVTITGNNLVYESKPTKVYFGTIPAKVINQSETTLTVSVPAGATYDRISVVISPTGTAISEQFFLVRTPSPCDFKTPVFDAPKAIATAPAQPVFIDLADMNGDGKEDLLVLSSDLKLYNRFTIFTNLSTPTATFFEKTYEVSLGAIPTSLAVGNLNTDAFMDIVIGYASGNIITLIPGSNGTAFGTLLNITVGIKNPVIPQYVVINDLNNDGISDIITGNRNAIEGVSILTKSSPSGLDYATATTIATTRSVTSIAVGDVNLDGKKDIITAEGKAYYYSGADGYGNKVELSDALTNPVLTGDYDQNGQTDIILGFDGIIGTYSESNGNRQSDKVFSGNPSSIAGSDYNSDGNADIAAVFADPKTNQNYIAFGLNDGSGSMQFDKTYIETPFTGETGLAAGDVNQDGQADFVIYDPNSKIIYLYSKSSSVSIDPKSVSATSPCTSSPATVTGQTNAGTIVWLSSTNGNDIITTGKSAQIPATYLPSSSNTIYYRASSGSCNTPITPLTITVKPKPTLSVTGSGTEICPGNSVSVRVSGASSYSWSPNTRDVESPTQANTIITPRDALTDKDTTKHIDIYRYTVTGTGTNECTNTNDVYVYVNSNKASITTDKDIICSGDVVTFTVNSTSPFSKPGYTWSTYPKEYPTPGTATPIVVSPTNPGEKAVNITYYIDGTIGGCPVTTKKTITVRPIPTIASPSSLPRGIVENEYIAGNFKVSDGVNPEFNMEPLLDKSSKVPLGLFFKGNTLTGKPTTAGTYTFKIVSTEPGLCSATATYTLRIEDLAEPKLTVSPVFATFGDNNFSIKPPITSSDGTLTYEIKSGFKSACVQLDPNGFVSNISCTDSIPFIVKQAQTRKYKAGSAETYIKIYPNPNTNLSLATTGVVLAEGKSQLQYATNSNAPRTDIEFVQLNNTDIAEIRSDGTIIPYKTGSVEIEVRVPATNQYRAVTHTAKITVYENEQYPILVNDTIIISVNQDTIVNILANDQGITRAIAPAQTDIDVEIPGVQSKYYSIGVGNFLIDRNGNVAFKPFAGFTGSGEIGYTVTDSSGAQSEQGHVYIKVIPLEIIPALKANEVMTPNNDGANDGLIIAYAELDENNSLTVLDEAGNVVYETTNYHNDWRGTNKKGNALEPGIYFYVYKEKVSGRSLQQYIQILK